MLEEIHPASLLHSFLPPPCSSVVSHQAQESIFMSKDPFFPEPCPLLWCIGGWAHEQVRGRAREGTGRIPWLWANSRGIQRRWEGWSENIINQKRWSKNAEARLSWQAWLYLCRSGRGVGGSVKGEWDAGRCRECSRGWPPQQRAKDMDPGAADWMPIKAGTFMHHWASGHPRSHTGMKLPSRSGWYESHFVPRWVVLLKGKLNAPPPPAVCRRVSEEVCSFICRERTISGPDWQNLIECCSRRSAAESVLRFSLWGERRVLERLIECLSCISSAMNFFIRHNSIRCGSLRALQPNSTLAQVRQSNA